MQGMTQQWCCNETPGVINVCCWKRAENHKMTHCRHFRQLFKWRFDYSRFLSLKSFIPWPAAFGITGEKWYSINYALQKWSECDFEILQIIRLFVDQHVGVILSSYHPLFLIKICMLICWFWFVLLWVGITITISVVLSSSKRGCWSTIFQ